MHPSTPSLQVLTHKNKLFLHSSNPSINITGQDRIHSSKIPPFVCQGSSLRGLFLMEVRDIVRHRSCSNERDNSLYLEVVFYSSITVGNTIQTCLKTISVHCSIDPSRTTVSANWPAFAINASICPKSVIMPEMSFPTL
jgi:hypothetical protein